MKAILLAGGLGTRLRGMVPGLPKPMAPVGDKPFISILIANLVKWGITEITLSVGFQHEIISDYFGDSFHGIPLRYVVEETPLGTGGALKRALLDYLPDEPVFVFNGDTFIEIDLSAMYRAYSEGSDADVGIALREVPDTSRYGRVDLTADGNVLNFEEKGVGGPGLINAGVYLLRGRFMNRFDLPKKFSIEYDFFVGKLSYIRFFPYITDGFFIDIGLPEEYKRAQMELKVYSY
jgi:D-glycero-alpha-D-manno-heptose 1-phosphate guanylyltransferase